MRMKIYKEVPIKTFMKKSGKKNNQSTDRRNIYLTIINLLEQGKYPSQIAREIKISKQGLSYYIKKLKKIKLITKMGYGVWAVSPLAVEEVKNKLEKTTEVANLPIEEINNISIYKFRNYLKYNKLNTCIFCNKSNTDLHHILPKSEGGKDSIFNLIPLCQNHHKSVHSNGISTNMQNKINQFQEKLEKIEFEDKIRGHAFQIKLKLPDIKNWTSLNRKRYLLKKKILFKPLNFGRGGESIIVNGSKVWLTDKSLIVYEKESFIEDTAKKCGSLAIQSFIEKIEKIEQIFGISLKYAGKHRFRVTRQHYARMKDELAKQYNREGKRLNIYNERGLWFLIDNSFNLQESETVHPETAEDDMDNTIIPFFNGLKKAEGYTPQFVMETILKVNENINTNAININQVTENQLMFNKNFESHVEAIRMLSKTVGELRDEIQTLRNRRNN